MHSCERALQQREVALHREGKLPRRSVGEPDDQRGASGLAAKHEHFAAGD
jgi:hypothetical protein